MSLTTKIAPKPFKIEGSNTVGIYEDDNKFNPLNIRGLQLLLTPKNATPEVWKGQSANGFNFPQNIATKQPTVITNLDRSKKVVFDGIDDFQMYSGVQPLNDFNGIIFFSWYSNGADIVTLFSSADNSVDNKFLNFQDRLGIFRIVTVNGATVNLIASTNSAVIGYNYGYIESIGTGLGRHYLMNLNGANEILNITSGFDNGTWFADILGRNNLVVASGQRLTPFYTKSQNNKLLYSNAELTTAEKNAINKWMSNPLNM